MEARNTADGNVVDVSRLMDEARVSALTKRCLAFSVLIAFLDGYDITNIGYAGPALVKAWAITDQSALGPVFGASLIGMLFGAMLLGALGDRFGRKKAIVLSGLIFGGFTWAAVLTHTVTGLLITRLLCGIGIGGVLPNVAALNAEYAPRRLRATLVIVMFSGIGLGSAVPGPVAAWLVPTMGWQILFTIGGAFAILASIGCMIGLPESIKYLVVREGSSAKVARMMRSIRPELSFPPGTVFSVPEEQRYSSASPKYLFADGLGPMTLLLWVMFATSLMGYFFLMSWTPILLTSLHIPVTKVALAASVFHIGGLIGGWVICRPVDLRGMMPVALLYAIAIPVVGLIGYAGSLSEPLLMAFLFVAGFCVLGGIYSVNAMSGIIYPTAIRSSGSGWAFGIGRIGSVLGPVMGGVLVGAHMPAAQLYLWAAVPFLICAPACYLFARRYNARFHRAPGTAAGKP